MFRKDEKNRIYFEKPKMFKKLHKTDEIDDIIIKIIIAFLVITLGALLIGLLGTFIYKIIEAISWWIIPLIISLPFIGYGLYWVGSKIID